MCHVALGLCCTLCLISESEEYASCQQRHSVLLQWLTRKGIWMKIFIFNFFLPIIMSIIWIYVVSLAGHLVWHNINVGHYRQTDWPNVVIPAMLIGAIDFYHFIQLSLTLTLPGGHKVSAKLSLRIGFFFSHTLFIRSGRNLMWWWSNLSWIFWVYFWVRCSERRETTAVLHQKLF